MGEIREAATAGNAEAARVTTMPIPNATSRASGLMGRPVTNTARVLRRKPMINPASPTPRIRPRALPMAATAAPCRRKRPITWRLVRPAARRRPISRVCSERSSQRVGDQERADHERDQPEEEGDPGEALLRAPQAELLIATLSTRMARSCRSSASSTSCARPSATTRST